MSDHQEFIEAVRRAREVDARFFSNSAKPERESWVVGEFLSRLDIQFSPNEIESQPEDDPVDVSFREARFQVKEIVDPAERRHQAIKQSLQRARHATTLRDLIEPVEGRDIDPADLAELLHDVASSIKYPPRQRSALDLLVYVTRPYVGFNEPAQQACEALASLGWRSISCLFGQQPLLLVATSASPGFLRPK
jgi:hypothetical protein